MRLKAEGYLAHSEKRAGAKFSARMVAAKTTHAARSPQRIHAVLEALTARRTATADTSRKAKSIARHQVGAALQQVLAQAWATNRNGVATQWIMHRKLAAAPTVSALMENELTRVWIGGVKLPPELINATQLH